jgi:hypothetical protein
VFQGVVAERQDASSHVSGQKVRINMTSWYHFSCAVQVRRCMSGMPLQRKLRQMMNPHCSF